MEKRDFLLREIEKLTQLIRKLFGIVEGITSENFDIEFSKIDNEIADFLGFTFEELACIENSKLIDSIKEIDKTNLELLAKLISEVLKKLHSTNNNYNLNSSELAKKGIVLIDFIDETSKTFSINRMYLKKELQQQT